MASCAAGAYLSGSGAKDRSSIKTINVPHQDVVVYSNSNALQLQECCSTERVGAGMAIGCASAIHMWTGNHHTGGSLDATEGYPKKVWDMKFRIPMSRTVESAAHTATKWFDTVLLWERMGYPVVGKAAEPAKAGRAPLRAVEPVLTSTLQIKMTEDVSMRISSSPAGTARIYLAGAAGKALLSSPLAHIADVTSDLPAVYEAIKVIDREPFAYHVGTSYFLADAAR